MRCLLLPLSSALYAMKNYQCASCGKGFNSSEAICEDWSVPEKCFICPHCNVSLEKVSIFEQWHEIKAHPVKSFVTIIVSVSLVVFGLWAFAYGITNFPKVPEQYSPYIRVMLVIVAVVSQIYWYLSSRNRKRELYYEKTRVTGSRGV